MKCPYGCGQSFTNNYELRVHMTDSCPKRPK